MIQSEKETAIQKEFGNISECHYDNYYQTHQLVRLAMQAVKINLLLVVLIPPEVLGVITGTYY